MQGLFERLFPPLALFASWMMLQFKKSPRGASSGAFLFCFRDLDFFPEVFGIVNLIIRSYKKCLYIIQGFSKLHAILQTQGKAGGTQCIPVYRLVGNNSNSDQSIVIGISGFRIEQVMI